jgi:endonuclease/exonuclease/phosphatase (EEP) superfamily protein YafD
MLFLFSPNARGRAWRILAICVVLFLSKFTCAQVNALKVLTFNTWLLNVGPIEWAQDIDERIALIPIHVKQTQADVILLQEVWADDYKKQLIRGFEKQGYSYFSWTPHEANGLLIVSRFPILKQKILVFSEYTNFEESFKDKGALYVELEIPGLGLVDVFNTHMGSIDFFEKDKYFNSNHERVVQKQIRELLDFIQSSHHNPTWIVGGDFNFHYDAWLAKRFWPVPSELYDALTRSWYHKFKFYDNFRWTRDRSQSTPYTYGSENPYVKDDQKYKGPSLTLDYVFTNQSSQNQLKATFSEKVFTQAPKPELKSLFGLSKLPKRLSDHFGILVHFKAHSL